MSNLVLKLLVYTLINADDSFKKTTEAYAKSKYTQTNGGSLPSVTGFRLHFHVRSTRINPELKKTSSLLDLTRYP